MQIWNSLPEPARYYPFSEGKYKITTGLLKLQTGFGNGVLDGQIFQLDNCFQFYRTEKLLGRQERLDKYVQINPDDITTNRIAVSTLIHVLCNEHPDFFQQQILPDQCICLHCNLTGESLYFNGDYSLYHSENSVQPVYSHALDALACQLQEDLAIITLDSEKNENRVSALHLCFPNYWAAEDKIGKNFIATHAPVPGFEKIGRMSGKLLHTLSHQGPFVRFAWGLATDNRLNHHPVPPPGEPASPWNGRSFNPDHPRLYVRCERQTTIPLQNNKGFLFTIRTYFEDVSNMKKEPEKIKNLAQAIYSMNDEILIYKGLKESREMILKWLENLC